MLVKTSTDFLDWQPDSYFNRNNSSCCTSVLMAGRIQATCQRTCEKSGLGTVRLFPYQIGARCTGVVQIVQANLKKNE